MRVISLAHPFVERRRAAPSRPAPSCPIRRLTVASTRRAIVAPSAQPTSRPPCSRTRSSIACAQLVLLGRPAAGPDLAEHEAQHLLVAPALDQSAQRPRHHHAGRRRRPGAAARSARPRAAPARPPRWPAAGAAGPPMPAAAGRAASGSERKRCRMPGRSSRPSVRATSSAREHVVGDEAGRARGRAAAFCAGMIAVCGIGMPSGWRNSAVTANQSAMPPTNPALAAACSRSVPQPCGSA